jgi:hypothetical protein
MVWCLYSYLVHGLRALTGDLLDGTTAGGAITAVVCILLPAEAGRGVGGTVSVLDITTEIRGGPATVSDSIVDTVRSGLSAQVESGSGLNPDLTFFDKNICTIFVNYFSKMIQFVFDSIHIASENLS